jgi:16S rRNA (adenine1518-N6/adenine1519-N6)-dimethyltransferase
MRITPLETPLVPIEELVEFRTFVQAAFGMRRKQLANILRSVRRLSLDDATALLEGQGIDPRARPETLSPTQLASVMRAAR